MIIHTNFPLSQILAYKIGGCAKTVLQIENEQDLKDALEYITTYSVSQYLPVGIGANLLINDKPYNGVVLWFSQPKKELIQQIDETHIKVFASYLLDDVIHYSFQHNLVGLEWAGGLPSTIGAAVRGNVGCFGHEIKDLVEKIEIAKLGNATFVEKTLSRDECLFSYRNSFIKHHTNMFVVNAYFTLKKGSTEEIEKAKEIYKENISYREKNHPLDFPSCGSVFKNTTSKKDVEKIVSIWPDIAQLVEQKWHGKVAMGYIINRLGFAGKTKGGAEISEKHANYILNKNNASFNDVYGLITEIQETFFQTFGFKPEPEVEIIH